MYLSVDKVYSTTLAKLILNPNVFHSIYQLFAKNSYLKFLESVEKYENSQKIRG